MTSLVARNGRMARRALLAAVKRRGRIDSIPFLDRETVGVTVRVRRRDADERSVSHGRQLCFAHRERMGVAIGRGLPGNPAGWRSLGLGSQDRNGVGVAL